MGYEISIGEAVILWEDDHVRIAVETEMLDNAPTHGEPTDKTNERWPSYTAWLDAMRDLGIEGIVLGESKIKYQDVWLVPLMANHPGVAPITQGHVDFVEQKISQYKASHPGHIAKYPPLKTGVKPVIQGSRFYSEDSYVDDPIYDGSLVRGEWLLFWMKWAVVNCDKPVIVNR